MFHSTLGRGVNEIVWRDAGELRRRRRDEEDATACKRSWSIPKTRYQTGLRTSFHMLRGMFHHEKWDLYVDGEMLVKERHRSPQRWTVVNDFSPVLVYVGKDNPAKGPRAVRGLYTEENRNYKLHREKGDRVMTGLGGTSKHVDRGQQLEDSVP